MSVRQASAVHRAQLAGTGVAAPLVSFVEGFDAIATWNVTPLGLALGGLALSRGSPVCTVAAGLLPAVLAIVFTLD